MFDNNFRIKCCALGHNTIKPDNPAIPRIKKLLNGNENSNKIGKTSHKTLYFINLLLFVFKIVIS